MAVGVADVAVLAELFVVIDRTTPVGSGDFPCRSDRYPHGMVEYGWFNAEKGHVYLCDERGVRTGTSKALRPGESAEEVARRLLKDEVGKNAGPTSVDRFAIRSWFISSGHLPTIPGADWSAGGTASVMWSPAHTSAGRPGWRSSDVQRADCLNNYSLNRI